MGLLQFMKRGNEGFSYRDANLATEVSTVASKLVAWTLVRKGLSYWRAVRGQEPGVRRPTVRAAKITGTRVRMIEQHYGKLVQDDARERLNRIAFA